MKAQAIKNAWHITAAETKPYVVIVLTVALAIPAIILLGLLEVFSIAKRTPSSISEKWTRLKHERDVFRGVVMRTRIDREKQSQGEQA